MRIGNKNQNNKSTIFMKDISIKNEEINSNFKNSISTFIQKN